MPRRLFLLIIAVLIGVVLLTPFAPSSPAFASEPPAPKVEQSVQAFLDAQPGPLKSYRDGDQTAAEIVQAVGSYYGVSPRILLALLEATNGLLSTSAVADDVLRHPFSRSGPTGFDSQLDWAGREVRAGFGPYERPPTIAFTDGTTTTLTLQQAPEGVAVQRFLAKNRSQAEWLTVYNRFLQAFHTYFNNELPSESPALPPAANGFLRRPWPQGTRVVHLAYFDHMFPTVDTGKDDNGYVVNYLGRGSVQYDGHDGHDFYFPNQPIGTYILAAADGVAYARTHRGYGVVIIHPDGYETVYWHLDKFARMFMGKLDTDQGVPVKAGDIIGSSGKTGFTTGTPHLHFEVRHNGKQVDPYGWYGPGDDPCAAYVACEPSHWLWHNDLAGEFDFAPPGAPQPDRAPPTANITVAPPDDLLFLADFDNGPLQNVGRGTPTIDGTPTDRETGGGRGVSIGADDRLAYPVDGNLDLSSGTIAFKLELPQQYPATSTRRNYIFATSAHPAERPVYTGTLALRRELAVADGTPRWNFWTTPESGDAGRNDLTTPDTLTPGTHHFALTWDQTRRTKALYINGQRVAVAFGVTLPARVGELLDLARFSPGHGQSGIVIDTLAIYKRALTPTEIAALTSTENVLPTPARVMDPRVRLDTNAIDDAGGIMGVQLGINGVFGDPQPYEDSYTLNLPAAPGDYTIAARFHDRAGNTSTVSTTVALQPASWPTVLLADVSEQGATLVFSHTKETTSTIGISQTEFQVSQTPQFSSSVWLPLPERLPWQWPFEAPRALWVRFRDENGYISTLQPFGPHARMSYLPLIAR